MTSTAFTAGLSMGLSLIVAIGAQNAFVLRQGLLRRHVFVVCLTCAVSDAILITVGVTSFAQVAAVLPWLDPAMRWGGALFLAWYGMKSFRSAWTSTAALAADGGGSGAGDLRRTLLTCLAFTWLNPHVYLDTVVLLGSISTQFDGATASFGLGAATGSFLFFFGLGYGAAWLRPVFAKPQAWRLLEGGIGLVMWAIAAMLVRG